MENIAEKRQELYGPERNVRVQKIRNKLTRSHVLQDGEYNFTNRTLGKNIWNTSHSTDFSVSRRLRKGIQRATSYADNESPDQTEQGFRC